jgi:uncharacterized membrane protein YczE
MFLPLPSDRRAERVVRCMAGLALFGLGISMFITSELGVAPWDVFHQGFGRKVGISTGIVIEMTGVVILLLWIPLRERMGLGTLLTRSRSAWSFLIDDHLPPATCSWCAAPTAACCRSRSDRGCIGAGLGSGPRDGLMLGLSKRGISVRVARTGIEVSVLIVGLLMGGTIGVGTVAFTFGIGPLVQFFLPRLRPKGDATVLATAH